MQKISLNKKAKVISLNNVVDVFRKISKVKNSSPKTIDYYLISVYTFNKYCKNILKEIKL